MSGKKTIYFMIVFLVLIAVGAYWYVKQPSPADKQVETPNQVIAGVRTILLKRGAIEQTVTAYGTVVAAIGQTRTFSVPFECRVQKVLVTAGQAVEMNTPLIEISPSPDSRLRFAQACAERDTAKNNLQIIQQRMEMKLATRLDVTSAEQTLGMAELNVKSMADQGIDGNKTILADSAGLISQINVEQGEIVSAGAPMVASIGDGQISVIVGVENDDVNLLRSGQDVQLYQVNAAEKKTIDGKIGLVTHRVNQQTRMVDVFVIPQAGAKLLLNQYIEARIMIRSDEGLLVPRSAILPEGNNYVLYTVENGCAVKHMVSLGMKNADRVEVVSDQLQPGQQVVVTGNYELEDKMSVKVEQSNERD